MLFQGALTALVVISLGRLTFSFYGAYFTGQFLQNLQSRQLNETLSYVRYD